MHEEVHSCRSSGKIWMFYLVFYFYSGWEDDLVGAKPHDFQVWCSGNFTHPTGQRMFCSTHQTYKDPPCLFFGVTPGASIEGYAGL